MASPLENIVISQSVVGFKTAFLKDIVLVHLDIRNNGPGAIEDVYIGFYSDIDLYTSRCFSLANNSVAFDSSNTITYTYPGEAILDAELGCQTPVIGYTMFCRQCEEAGASTYHTMLGKNNDLREFGETHLRSPQDVHLRLQGRSSTGEPMTNPVTGEATNFAFTGDPVSATGWIGIKSDVRSLLSVGSFSLPRGGRVGVTVAIVAKEGDKLSDALRQMRQQFSLFERIGILDTLAF